MSMRFRSRPSQRPAAARPGVERLEDRCVLDGSFGPWGTPVNLGSVVNTPSSDHRPTLSKDGLSLYFGSNRPGSVGTVEGTDLYVSQRASVNDPWGPPAKVEALSSAGDDNAPAFSPDGHWVYFGSDRPGGCGGYDLWAAHRQDKDDDFGWETPVNLGCTINSPQNDDGPTYFEDENGSVTLYFTSFQRPGGLGDWDIYASHATADDHLSFGPATNVPELNSPRRDTRTSISRDGLEMFITSNRAGSILDGSGQPSLDIWVSTRASTADPWSIPLNVGAPINTAANDGAPSLSFDGLTLYFDSTRPGGFGSRDLYVTTRKKLDGEDGGEPSDLAADVARKAGKGQQDLARKAGGVQTEFLRRKGNEQQEVLVLGDPVGSSRVVVLTPHGAPAAGKQDAPAPSSLPPVLLSEMDESRANAAAEPSSARPAAADPLFADLASGLPRDELAAALPRAD